MGRRSTFDQAIADEICERISEGEILRSICRDDRMPAWRTVYWWIEDHPEFAAAYARARAVGFDAIAAEALEIADTQVQGERRKETSDGVEVTTEDMLGHRKLQIETRLKLLAKWDPKRYGDRIEHTGAGGGAIQVAVVTAVPDADPQP